VEHDGIRESLLDTLRALKGALQAANNLVPMVVPVFSYLSITVVFLVIRYSPLMMALTVLVVLAVSVAVYVTSRNYGEAALSLVAGLLTVFSVDWTPSRFIVFMVVWIAFSLLAVMIASVRIAAHIEAIYREASLALADHPLASERIERELIRIGKAVRNGALGPIESAETIRLLCYRKLSVNAIQHALKAVGLLSLVTKAEPKTAAVFVADVYRLLQTTGGLQYEKVLDWVYSLIRETPVLPVEFIEAFDRSRRAVLSGQVDVGQFFESLKLGLVSGVAPEDMYEFIISRQACP